MYREINQLIVGVYNGDEPHNFLAVPQTKCTKIDILEEFRNCHEIDEAVALLTAYRLISKPLCV